MSRKPLVAVLTLVLLVGVGLFSVWYVAWYLKDAEQEQGVGPELVGPDPLYSNILPADYVGPDTCGKCHEENHRRWSTHPHRFMNQLVSQTAIKGDFADAVLTVRPGFTVTFSTQGSDYFMTVDRPARPRNRYKVTRTVGSRFVQYYIGVQTEGPEPASHPVYTTEHRLFFGYWLRMKRWLPVDYFDVGEEVSEAVQDDLPVVDGVDNNWTLLPYADTCVHCHNTYPDAYRLFRPTLRGFPGAVINGDFNELSAALADKVKVKPNAEAFALLPYTMDYKKDLVTVGISCESCHMGGREHATLEKAISFYPTNPHVHVSSRTEEKPFTGERKNPATSQGICAQCHSARAVSTYPNGARIRNSSEAKDLLEGACTTKIRCVTCHEPHTAGVPSGGPDLPKYLDACVKCHPAYSGPQQAAAHSRHTEKSGVNCLDCHMARISQGIDEMSRTHRIAVPVEQSMISAGAPNACNLCHVDKPVRWTLDELKRGWGKEIQPLAKTPAEWLEQPAGKVWLQSRQPITRMVATEAYARSPQWQTYLPDVLSSLNDGAAPNRAFAMFSIERMLGRPLTVGEIDITGGPAQRRRQIEILHAKLKKKK